MLTQFNWCISVALCLDAQLVVSKTDPMLRSLVRRVPLAESKQKTANPVALGQLNDGVPVSDQCVLGSFDNY